MSSAVFSRLLDTLFARRASIRLVVILAALAMGLLAWQRLQVASGPEQLYPLAHPTIATHERFASAFGSANALVVMFQVREGDLFQLDVLRELAALTRRLESVPAADPYQVVSLASRKLRHISASSYGVDIEPLMWPEPPADEAEVARLRERVLANDIVYGNFVSQDLRSALIVVGFVDDTIARGEVSYAQIHASVREAMAAVAHPAVETYVVGEPVLQALALDYVPQTMLLAGAIAVLLIVLLWLAMGSVLGTALPVLAAMLSAAFALGAVAVAGLRLDPLMMVLAFLMAARSISHSVQFCRLYAEARTRCAPLPAARHTLVTLFRPSTLGLATDVGAVAVMLTTPIPILRGAALIGVIWLSTLMISVVLLIPLVLADLQWAAFRPRRWHRPFDRALHWLGRTLAARHVAPMVLVGTVAIIALAGWRSLGLQIGDAFPGTPLLWPDSPFNRAVAAIDDAFPGAERMFLVVEGEADEAMKDPQVLQAIGRVQAELERQPEIVGTLALPDLVAPLNMMLREGNPRYREVPDDREAIGQLIAMLEQSADPGDLGQYRTQDYRHGAIHLQLRDHQGPTLRAVQARVAEVVAGLPPGLPVSFRFGGGFPAVLAAVNDTIAANLVSTVAFALALLFACCWVSYRLSWQAGLFFLPGVVLSNAVTFAYMAWRDIGLTINTLPVLTLGIGLGVDFGFYIVDRIREHYRQHADAAEAVLDALQTAGKGVVITGSTMILAVVLWQLSALRFQAEMGVLIALWMAVAATAALTVVPALALVFRPAFIFEPAPAAAALGTAGCADCPQRAGGPASIGRHAWQILRGCLPAWAMRRPARVPLCSVEAVPKAAGKPIRLSDGRLVAVFRTAEGFHVIDDTCTHGTASLSEGDYDPATGRVECPWHGGVFDVRTGMPLAPPVKLPLRRYDVYRDGDTLLLEPTQTPAGAPMPAPVRVAP
ncbi:MAG: efflux RND transporter permease subunit [Pseudomonadota bacterium]|nr:efflux RND transporter permease subunit [Pseudomonadota bacterium]